MQLSWADLGPGRHTVTVGGRDQEHDAGAGTALFEDLPPATDLAVAVDGAVVTTARTLPPPPGRLLAKVATISDCHLFEDGFGAFVRMRERAAADHYTLRCLRAAVGAAVAWGAELLVVKGDLTNRALPDELRTAADVLAAAGIPVVVVPGNHEVKRGGTPWVPPVAGAGLSVADRTGGTGVLTQDVPGLRVVAADTTIHGQHAGTLSTAVREEVLEAVGEADRPVLVCVHHQLERRRARLHYPPGVPPATAVPFLDALVALGHDVWITSGHTHRCRAGRYGPLVTTEVGSTKDGAGCWAGYAVHEGGLRQVVRRVTGDGTDEWLDRSRRALGGLWGLYAPGRLDQRCFTHTWLSRA